MIHRLYQEQQLNCDLQTAWTFFSAAGNLSKITPPEMKFTVLTSFANDEIYEGMLIRYRVSPLFGISMNWETKITQVDYQKSFTDFQAKGPYKLWNHHHEFIPNDKGVLMKDTVDYELPFGWLGELSHNWMVKPRLDEIFRYRHQVLEKKFGHTPPI